HEFAGEQVVWMDRAGELTNPRTGQPTAPRFLGDDKLAAFAPDADRLQLLADWVADPGNPFFAKAQVNRAWFHLFGRGLVARKGVSLWGGFSRVLEAPVKFDGFPLGIRAGQLPDAQVGARGVLPGAGPRFLKAFGKPDRQLSCECERGDETTLVQAFQLLTG